jgi:hypothetical protein
MCSPPFFESLEKLGGALLRAAQRLDPVVEEVRAGGRERVATLRGTGGGLVPLRRDEAFLLERAEEPVEIAHLDALLAGQLRQALEQVVAVRGAFPQK